MNIDMVQGSLSGVPHAGVVAAARRHPQIQRLMVFGAPRMEAHQPAT